MTKIRINDLARELEVKSKAVLDYLHELGVADVRSHSSAIEEDAAAKVRAHFRVGSEEMEAERVEPRPSAPSAHVAAPPAPALPHAPAHEPAKVPEVKSEHPALSR